MSKPKKETEPEETEDINEGFIDELEGEDKEKESDNQEDWRSYLDKLQSILDKHQKGIAVNQKYIRKIWERVKELEANFKILLEQVDTK